MCWLARFRRSSSLSFAALAVISMLPLLSSCGSHGEPARVPEGLIGQARAVADGRQQQDRPVPRDPQPVLAAEVAATTPPSAPPVAPTWSMIYGRYFAVKTEGACGRAHGCHSNEMADAASAYSWLEGRGYIAGPLSPIASTTNSCLRWFGGNMPPGGKPNPHAADELSAWVAAGAPNN